METRRTQMSRVPSSGMQRRRCSETWRGNGVVPATHMILLGTQVGVRYQHPQSEIDIPQVRFLLHFMSTLHQTLHSTHRIVVGWPNISAQCHRCTCMRTLQQLMRGSGAPWKVCCGPESSRILPSAFCHFEKKALMLVLASLSLVRWYHRNLCCWKREVKSFQIHQKRLNPQQQCLPLE